MAVHCAAYSVRCLWFYYLSSIMQPIWIERETSQRTISWLQLQLHKWLDQVRRHAGQSCMPVCDTEHVNNLWAEFLLHSLPATSVTCYSSWSCRAMHFKMTGFSFVLAYVCWLLHISWSVCTGTPMHSSDWLGHCAGITQPRSQAAPQHWNSIISLKQSMALKPSPNGFEAGPTASNLRWLYTHLDSFKTGRQFKVMVYWKRVKCTLKF